MRRNLEPISKSILIENATSIRGGQLVKTYRIFENIAFRSLGLALMRAENISLFDFEIGSSQDPDGGPGSSTGYLMPNFSSKAINAF